MPFGPRRPVVLGRVSAAAVVADVTAPTLSSATAGTATSDGATSFGVSTDEGNGTLYWAVVTNGGSCTDAQLKAGSGGNIVSGKAGSQAVSSTGAQTVTSVTGLTSSTTYQIKFLHRDAAGNDSAQASVSLTTSAAPSIAFDAASEITGLAASPRTWSHTCTGSNRILFVSAIGPVGTDNVSGVTYGGVAMTLVGKVQLPTSRWLYLFYLINPASGANNVSINGSTECAGLAVSYTGAKQSGQPDASTTDSATSVTTRTTSVTTVADNCWLVGTSIWSGVTTGVGAGTTSRKLWATAAQYNIFDSNAAKTPAGSYGLITTNTSSRDLAQIVASIAPA